MPPWEAAMIRLKPRVDAKEALWLDVSHLHCRSGRRGDPYNCVFSRALRAALGRQVGQVQVMRNTVSIEMRTEVRRWRIYGALRDAIIRYDLTGDFPAGRYKLSAMPQSWSLDAVWLKNQQWSHDRTSNYEARVRRAKEKSLPPPPLPKYDRPRRQKAGHRGPVHYIKPRGAPGYSTTK